MKIKTKDLLTLSELTPKEFLGLIDHSIKLKKELKNNSRFTCKSESFFVPLYCWVERVTHFNSLNNYYYVSISIKFIRIIIV